MALDSLLKTSGEVKYPKSYLSHRSCLTLLNKEEESR